MNALFFLNSAYLIQLTMAHKHYIRALRHDLLVVWAKLRRQPLPPEEPEPEPEYSLHHSRHQSHAIKGELPGEAEMAQTPGGTALPERVDAFAQREDEAVDAKITLERAKAARQAAQLELDQAVAAAREADTLADAERQMLQTQLQTVRAAWERSHESSTVL